MRFRSTLTTFLLVLGLAVAASAAPKQGETGVAIFAARTDRHRKNQSCPTNNDLVQFASVLSCSHP